MIVKEYGERLLKAKLMQYKLVTMENRLNLKDSRSGLIRIGFVSLFITYIHNDLCSNITILMVITRL